MNLQNTVRRTRLVIAASLVALALAACGGSSDGDEGTRPEEDFKAAPAKDLPPATDLVADEGTVAAGTWGVIEHGGGTQDTVLGLKITDVKAGKKGEFKDVRGAGDLSSSTPYFISYSWAVISGDSSFSPSQRLASLDGKALSVPQRLIKCKIPEARVNPTEAMGAEQRGCQVVVMDSGAPSALVFDSLSGSRRVSFALN